MRKPTKKQKTGSTKKVPRADGREQRRRMVEEVIRENSTPEQLRSLAATKGPFGGSPPKHLIFRDRLSEQERQEVLERSGNAKIQLLSHAWSELVQLPFEPQKRPVVYCLRVQTLDIAARFCGAIDQKFRGELLSFSILFQAPKFDNPMVEIRARNLTLSQLEEASAAAELFMSVEIEGTPTVEIDGTPTVEIDNTPLPVQIQR